MDDDLLELFITQYIEAQTEPQVLFIWHGGEPLLCGLDYYRKIIQLQKKHAHGKIIDNEIQTNATLINDEWAEFLHDNGWLVGVSIDGPEVFHDTFRKTANGKSSFDKVMVGIEILNRHNVMWNVMAVVNNFNAQHPVEVYNFLKSLGTKYIQFTPLVGKEDAVKPKQWGRFLCGVYDEWEKNDIGEIFVGIIEATLANYMGVIPGICCFSPQCGQVGVIEQNGDLFSCDHFVFPDYKLGNIREHTIYELMHGEKQKKFGRRKSNSLPSKCMNCKYMMLCNGECPKNRLSVSPDGEPGQNSLCEGYYMYFKHTERSMKHIIDTI